MKLNLELPKNTFTAYEKSRIIGSRSLQLSQGAPILIDLSDEELQELNYNSIEIAKKEFAEGKLPIQVDREKQLPKHREV